MKILFDEYGRLLLYVVVVLSCLCLFNCLKNIDTGNSKIEETCIVNVVIHPVKYTSKD